MIRMKLSTILGDYALTQADLYRMTGIRKNTLGLYYKDFTDSLSLNHLDLICEALECKPCDLLEYEPNKEPRVEFTAKKLLDERKKDPRYRG